MSKKAAMSESVKPSVGWVARKLRMSTARVADSAGLAIPFFSIAMKISLLQIGGSEECAVKLDLLYEFQPKIKPWSKPHPYGQRDAEQRIYEEAIAEIQ